ISVTNVMEASSLADYTGELEGRPVLRITDKDGAVSSTWRDLHLSVPVPCTATADATLGSACSTTASADAVIPGLVVEGARAVWELGRVQVLDGGGDGAASTSPNSTF